MSASMKKLNLLIAIEMGAIALLVGASIWRTNLESESARINQINDNAHRVDQLLSNAKHILKSYSESPGASLNSWSISTGKNLDSEFKLSSVWGSKHSETYTREYSSQLKRIHDLSQPVITALADPDKTVHDTAQFAAVNAKWDSLDAEFRDVLVRQSDVLMNNLMTKPFLDLAMIITQVTIAFVFGMLVRALNAVLISEKGVSLDGKTSRIQSSGS